jgi:hypothetical protein
MTTLWFFRETFYEEATDEYEAPHYCFRLYGGRCNSNRLVRMQIPGGNGNAATESTWLDDMEGQQHFQMEAFGKGFMITSKEASKENFVAEYNFKGHTVSEMGTGAWLGMMFSYKDKNNYACISIDPAAETVSLMHMRGGAASQIGEPVKLSADTDFTKLHTIRVEKNDNEVRIYFNGMKKAQGKLSLGGGAIGYVYEEVEPAFSYTAFSNDVNGSSDFEVFKTVPGTIQAERGKSRVLCTRCSRRG